MCWHLLLRCAFYICPKTPLSSPATIPASLVQRHPQYVACCLGHVNGHALVLGDPCWKEEACTAWLAVGWQQRHARQ